MEILVISQNEVASLLPMDECIEVMADALKAVTQGDVILPLRPVLWLPEKRGALGMMPAYMGGPMIMGVKLVSVFPENEGTEYDSHQGAVLLFEAQHGRLLALMDSSSITGIRTAGVTGLATRLLAREDAGDLAILGSGVQARTHLEAMLLVRKMRRVRVWSRNPDHTHEFAARESARLGIAVEVKDSVRETVQNADIICTTTAAPEPILFRDMVSDGAHINAVGSSVPFTRELDTPLVAGSKLFVDRRESVLNEAGDFLFPQKEGVIDKKHILGEIGELLIGRIGGRKSPEEITLFKSLGLAVEDLAAANHVYRKAMERGVGTSVELGGVRQ